MRVLLADYHAEVRSALRLLLEQEPDILVVAEAAQAAGLVTRVREERVDLILLDWELPGLDGVDLLHALHKKCPKPRVIALSGRPEARRASLRAGADAFVSKGDPPERLLAALRAVRDSPVC